MDHEFERRRKALEDSYCYKRDQELIERLAQRQAKAERLAGLAQATGIQDQAFLERLGELEIRAETLDALQLVPLVEIAWADGKVHAPQREAVLSAAKQAGLDKNYDAYHLLESWLDARPDETLLLAWKQYLCCLSRRMTAQQMQALQCETMDHALFVAEAAGGFFGFHRVHREERAKLDQLAAMLNEIAAAFTCPESAKADADCELVQADG